MKKLSEIKDEIALSYTSGKHTWNDGYLNKNIKCILMDTVAKRYAQEVLKEAAENAKMRLNTENILTGDFDDLVENVKNNYISVDKESITNIELK